jgi:hypothetical protein
MKPQMKPQMKTPISILFSDIQTNDGKIEIDYSTEPILKSFLMEYGIEPKHWQQIVTTWYKDHPYVSLKDIDRKVFMDFTIHFKLFLLGQLHEILNAENKAFAELYIKR